MNKEDLNIDDYYYAEYNSKYMPGFCIVKGTTGTRPNLYIETRKNYFYIRNSCSATKNIRLATPEEKHWLNECIRLNKFITKEVAMETFYKHKVVHCKTLEEWQYVNSKLPNVIRLSDDRYSQYQSNTCKHLYYGQYSSLNYWEAEEKTLILSFEDWCTKFNHTNFVVKEAKQGHKLYTLEELTKALTKEYDKIDVEDILKVIKTIK